MPWRNQDPGKRRQDAERYRDPEYLRNRKVVLRRAAGRCEQCSRRGRLQVDHITPLAVRVDHSLANLQALCSGPGSCHARKTARDSQGHRRPQDPAFTTSRTRWLPGP
jgi:HNH endonuclease